MFVDFLGVCLDQIFNQAAKFRYMFGGKAETPMVMRTMYGAGIRAASQHSQALYPIFTHIPGLKVVLPSNPYDAKGLLIQAIRDDDPVIFLEHKVLYTLEGDVPEESYTIPFGEANVVREGDDVTVVALGRMVQMAPAGRGLARRGSVEIIDPRTTSPLDEDTILESVEKTGRLVVVDEAGPRCGMAADIVALVARGGVRRPEGAAADGHAAAHAGPVLAGAGGRVRADRRTTIAAAIRETTGAAGSRHDREAGHAEVGPVDDRGAAARLARRGGRRGRRPATSLRGRDGEDHRRGGGDGGGGAAPPRRRVGRGDPGRRAARA